MDGFEFSIRRPLDSKTGELYQNSVLHFFRLQWPTLEICRTGSFQSPEHFPIQCCTFSPHPSADQTVQGEKAFCIRVRNNQSGAEVLWFARSERLRREWCFLLRKHAVHHDLANGFKASSADAHPRHRLAAAFVSAGPPRGGPCRPRPPHTARKRVFGTFPHGYPIIYLLD